MIKTLRRAAGANCRQGRSKQRGSAAATSRLDRRRGGRSARRRSNCWSCKTCSIRRCGDAATYQLPGAAFAERDGSYVNYADRLQSFTWAIRPPAGVWVEGQLYWQLAGHARACTSPPRARAKSRRDHRLLAPRPEPIPSVGIDLKARINWRRQRLGKHIANMESSCRLKSSSPLVKIALLIFGLMTAAAYLVLLERWMAAWVQDRRGPTAWAFR